MKNEEIRKLGLEMLLNEGEPFEIGAGISISYNVPFFGNRQWFGVIEVVAMSGFENVGYAILADKNDANYLIQNVLYGYKRPNLEYRAGHGIEVHPSFRRRKIGTAVLSLAIAIAQLRTPGTLKPEFKVTGFGEGQILELYMSMNFDISEKTILDDATVHIAEYTKNNEVPEFEIKPVVSPK